MTWSVVGDIEDDEKNSVGPVLLQQAAKLLGFQAVAMTEAPDSRAASTMARPKPGEDPVINHTSSFGGRSGGVSYDPRDGFVDIECSQKVR